MSDGGVRGPQVDATEDLYRCITTPDWWLANAGRPSSAAFHEPKFSVNVASLTTLAETERQLREQLGKPDAGIVSFQCGRARELGFDARHEIDDRFPDNKAHAHVYYDGGRSSRKKKARRLAEECVTVLAPSF
jgi:hypothetical protein